MAAGYRVIARVAKAHGSKGEVVAVSAGGLPPLLSEGMRVAVIPPALKGSRWHVVESVETSGAGQLVRLSGVDGIGEARAIAGKSILAAEADLPEDLAAHDPERLVGREVTDVRLGSLGTIVEVMLGPANDVWVVEGERGETLVPAVPEIVGEVTYGDAPIEVSLPVGLAPGDDGSSESARPCAGREPGEAADGRPSHLQREER